ncbi:MAG: type II toxin-antitoxin system YoeB family toxin [Ruminococcus sp.]|nr:type II toxin-antitoxin system YoeB family toxin [Ruminococcus sp.]
MTELCKDILRNGESVGIGHPEPLRGDKTGWWSRHIDDGNRLVYKLIGEDLWIAACKDHYDDK